MSVPYTRQTNEVEDDLGSSPMESMYNQIRYRGNYFPKSVGATEIIMGFIVSLLGAAEVFIIPMTESTDGTNLIEMSKRNCYGAGLFAGLTLVITGSTALRATMSKRNSTVYRFYNLTIFSMIIYAALTIFLIVGYYKGWTDNETLKPHTARHNVHILVMVFTTLSLLFVLTGFFRYFDIICCGEFPLWVQWVKCFCFCCYTQRLRSRLNYEQAFREELDDRSNPI